MVFAAKLTVDFEACLACDVTIVSSRYASYASTEDTDHRDSSLISGLSHELKNPTILSVSSFLEASFVFSSLRKGVVSS